MSAPPRKVEPIYCRIGEAAEQLGVPPHVLRYWESQFPRIRPQKSKSGQRIYTRKDIDALRQVQALLHDQGFTVQGAKKALRQHSPASVAPPPAAVAVDRSGPKLRVALTEIRNEAAAILARWELEG